MQKEDPRSRQAAQGLDAEAREAAEAPEDLGIVTHARLDPASR